MILGSKWLSETSDVVCHNVRHRFQKSLTECLFDCLCETLDERDLPFLVEMLAYSTITPIGPTLLFTG